MSFRAAILALSLPAVAFADADAYLPVVKVTPLTMAVTDSAGQPIAYPKTDKPEVRALIVEVPAGAKTGWHKHPFPCYAYMLEGELTVQTEGGKTNVVKAGDALVESVNLWHNGTNTGDTTARLVLFVTGERGKPFTVRE